MRYLTFLSLFVLSSLLIRAQERENILQVENSQGQFESFVSLKFMELSGLSALGYELGFGGIFRENWNFGLRFSEAATLSFEQSGEDENRSEQWQTRLLSGGAYAGYIYRPDQLLHFRAEIGSEMASWKRERRDGSANERFIFLLQPRLGLEANITSWCALSGWFGYQWIYAPDAARLRGDSPLGIISLRFGNFH